MTKRAKAQGLGHVLGFNRVARGKVGNGTRHTQYAMVAPRRQAKAPPRLQ